MRTGFSTSLVLAICIAASSGAGAVRYADKAVDAEQVQILQTRLGKIEELMMQAGDYQRYILLDTAARTAMQLEWHDKAGDYAYQLLQLAPRYPNDWNYASALHHSRIILGHIDLHRGNTDSAMRYLTAAGSVPASDILNQQLPDFSLAQALLQKGEKQAVENYLELCKSLWPDGLSQLDLWQRSLKAKHSIELIPRRR